MSDLRDLILRKSVEIVAENGIRGLSFREVARRANVSHQAPYHYFKNDSEILSAIAKDGFDKLGNAMKIAASKHVNKPIEALNSAGIAYVIFALNHLGHFRVMFQRTLLPEDISNSNITEAQEAYSVLRDLASAVIDVGGAKSLGLEGLVLLCWSTVHGMANLISEGLCGSNNDKKSQVQIATQVVEGLGTFVKLTMKK
jgi:AcrR family transcriptional regulator